MSIGPGLAQWCQEHQATPLPTPTTAVEVYPWPDPKISVLPIEIGNAAGHKVRTVVGWDNVAQQILEPGPGALVQPVSTAPPIMYDSDRAITIPQNVLCVAGYVDGWESQWAGLSTVPSGDWARFPDPCKRITISAVGANLADFGDCEPGDLNAQQCAGLVGQALFWGVYTDLDDPDGTGRYGVVAVKSAFASVNQPLKLFTAHWTGVPHICNAQTCKAELAGVDVVATQFANPRTSGGSYDLSQLTQEFWDSL